MNRTITTALGILGGFIGGAIFHFLFVPTTVQAQAQAATEVRAQKFILVDESGTAQGVFGFKPNGSPDVQIRVRTQEPKGLVKLIEAEFASPRWMGLNRGGAMLDLRTSSPPKAIPSSGTK